MLECKVGKVGLVFLKKEIYEKKLRTYIANILVYLNNLTII